MSLKLPKMFLAVQPLEISGEFIASLSNLKTLKIHTDLIDNYTTITAQLETE